MNNQTLARVIVDRIIDMNNQTLARVIVDRIIEDISDRCGMADNWTQIPPETQMEIRQAWRKIAEEEIEGNA